MTLIIDSGFTQWDPSLITTALWLDGADAGTLYDADTGGSLVANNGTVGRWEDKSGNTRNALQTTAGSRPTYIATGLNSKGVLSFDGDDDFMNVTTSIFQSIGAFQLFWIFSREGAGAGDNYKPSISSISNTNTDRGAFHYIKNDNDYGASYPFFQSSPSWGNYDLSSGTTYVNSVYNIMCFNNTSSQWQVFRDGTQEGTTGTTGGAPAADVDGIMLAKQVANNRRSQIRMGEVICVLSSSVDQREKIEGYLAHKWGLTANLPSDHPFKINPPAP